MGKKNKTNNGNLFKNQVDRRDFLKISGKVVVGSSLFLGSPLSQRSFAQESDQATIPDIELLHLTECPNEVIRLILNSWEKLGLRVRPISQPSHIVVPKAYNRDYNHVVYMSWTSMPERLEPGFWVSEFYHSRNARPGGRNWGDYVNPKADELIDQQEFELNLEKRRDLIWKIQALVAEDHPIWYVVHPDRITLYNSKKLGGLVNMLGCMPARADVPWSAINIELKGKEKVFRWGFDADIGQRNPFTQKNAHAFGFIRLVYDRFIQVSPELKLVPWAAESWNWVNNTTLDLKIRKGMKFHDGKPVTPEDAAFFFEYVLKHQMPGYGIVTKNLKGIKLLDDGTVRLFLEKASASYIWSALVWAHILPKHIWEKVDKPLEFEDIKLIGSGPFKITRWNKGERYLFESHKEHFSKPRSGGFYLIIIPSLETQTRLLKSGEIDLVYDERVSYSYAKELAEQPGISYISTDNPAFHEVRPKCTVRPFTDAQFRRALHHAIPKEEILKVGFEGRGTVGYNTVITPKNKFWHNSDIAFVDYDIEKSREILKKAGYYWNEKGRLCYPRKG